MFVLVTGLPGSSKTSHVIDRYMAVTDRPIYYHGIPLTQKGREQLGWHQLDRDQVTNWPEEIPPGSILIVDEAQRIFPTRAPSKPVPPALSALETHRHEGIDITFITQDPGLIDSHARKLVNEHYHYSRPFGAPFVFEYHSGSGVVSVGSKSELSACVKTKRGLPKRVYDLYKSAEVHTHKFRPPKILFIVPLLLLFTLFMGYRFITGFSDMGENDAKADPVYTSSYRDRFDVDSSSKNSQKKATQETWAYLLTPEIPGIPYTAPLYREAAMRVREVPIVAGCVIFQDECRCYTQQGTRIYDVHPGTCRAYVSTPPFNHLRENRAPETQRREHEEN